MKLYHVENSIKSRDWFVLAYTVASATEQVGYQTGITVDDLEATEVENGIVEVITRTKIDIY